MVIKNKGVNKGKGIQKKPVRPLSKKKQKSLSKSAKVMIDKMNVHTTDDDIFNIMKSIETKTDTKATGKDENGNGNGNENEDRNGNNNIKQGLVSLKTENLKTDQVKDQLTVEKERKVQSDITEQLKMINDFTL